MSDKDNELNELLKPLKHLSPDDLQMQKWQNAVLTEASMGRRTITTTRRRWVLQLALAVSVGFIMGAFVFRFLPSSSRSSVVATQNADDNATIEYFRANLN